MKKTLKLRVLSIAVVLFMLLAALPVGIFANEDESEEPLSPSDEQTVEEVPFEFPYLPGDLPLYELKDAVLPLSDVPAVISKAQIAEYDHVNRLYEQEPDAYTVIFQNRDGGKTVYVFDRPVKETKADGSIADMTASAIVSSSKNNTAALMTAMNTTNTATAIKAMQSRLEAYKTALDLQPYNMLEDKLEAQTLTTSGLAADLVSPMQITPNNSTEVMSVSNTYSNLAGEYALKNVGSATYLRQTNNVLGMNQNISLPYSKWLLTYTEEGYIIEAISKIGYVLAYNIYGEDTVSLEYYYEGSLMDDYSFYWSIGAISSTDYRIIADDVGKLLSKNLSLSYNDGSDPVDIRWQFTNHVDYIPLSSVSVSPTVMTVTSGFDYPTITSYPSNASYASSWHYEWYSTDESVVYLSGMGDFAIENPGVAQIYCKHKFTGKESNRVTVVVSDNMNIISESTYLLRPVSNINKLLTMNVGSSSTSLCLDSWRDTWKTRSQAFSFTANGDGSYKISAIMSTNQYGVTFNGDDLPYENSYYLVDKHQKANTLALVSNNPTLVAYKNSAGVETTENIKWYIYKDGSNYYIFTISGTTRYYLSYNNNTVEVSTDQEDASWILSFLGVDAPCIKQITDYYCGVASTLQVLMTVEADGYGPEDNVNLGVKMHYLNNTYDMTTSNGLRYWDEISEAMSAELDEGTYALLEKDDCSEAAVRQTLISSLENGYPLIGSIYDRLVYYPQDDPVYYNAKHYICIMGYDSATDKVIISDCIYESNFGIHVVYLDDLIDALRYGILYYVN